MIPVIDFKSDNLLEQIREAYTNCRLRCVSKPI